MISFHSHQGEAKLLNPLKGFELDVQPVEYRLDPLLGLTSVVRLGRRFWAGLYATDEKLLQGIVKESREHCFFCPEKVASATPRFPHDLLPEGRLRQGESILFPNLFAQKEWSAIAVISQEHYLSPGQFAPRLLADAFTLAQRYLRTVHEKQGATYAEIGWNYLFPAGASIVHPHLQVLASSVPYYLLARLLEAGQRHHQQYGVNYWEELIEAEKKQGQRYLGKIGDTEWYLPFAPTREDEVQAVVRNKSHFLELDREWLDLAEGLSRVLRFYQAKGLSSFNVALYSGPLGEKLDYFWTGLKIVSRSSVQAQPVNDVWYSNNLLFDGFVTEPPEELAPGLKEYFR